jgi:hypothetical protein
MKAETEHRIALAFTLLGVALLALFILTTAMRPQICCDGPCWDPSEDVR